MSLCVVAAGISYHRSICDGTFLLFRADTLKYIHISIPISSLLRNFHSKNSKWQKGDQKSILSGISVIWGNGKLLYKRSVISYKI